MVETAISGPNTEKQHPFFSKASRVKKYFPCPEDDIRKLMKDIIILVRGENYIRKHYISKLENDILDLKIKNPKNEIEDILEIELNK